MYNLRNATIDDAKLLFDWTNDDEVRATAVVKKSIDWNEHINWITNKLQNNQSYIYILTDDKNENIGVIRFDKDNDAFLISYSIDKLHRGKGMGYLILQLGIKKIIENEILCKFVALVQRDNIASNKIFEKLGFRLKNTDIIKEHTFNIYHKNGNE